MRAGSTGDHHHHDAARGDVPGAVAEGRHAPDGAQVRLGSLERQAELEASISELRAAVEGLGRHVRTRRLSIVDESGTERVVAEVRSGVAEVRVQLVEAAGRTAEVVLYATGFPEAAVGIHLRGGGDGVAELDAAVEDGQWRSSGLVEVSGTTAPRRRRQPPGPPRAGFGPSGSPPGDATDE